MYFELKNKRIILLTTRVLQHYCLPPYLSNLLIDMLFVLSLFDIAVGLPLLIIIMIMILMMMMILMARSSAIAERPRVASCH